MDRRQGLGWSVARAVGWTAATSPGGCAFDFDAGQGRGLPGPDGRPNLRYMRNGGDLPAARAGRGKGKMLIGPTRNPAISSVFSRMTPRPGSRSTEGDRNDKNGT